MRAIIVHSHFKHDSCVPYLFVFLQGGLKGVIWVDAIQMVIILVSILAIIIKGTIAVGGWAVVWQKASEGGRIRSNE